MAGTSYRSTIALFVALTRSLREAPLDDALREQAFEAVERMAGSCGHSSFEEHLRALQALASAHASLAGALEPFWGALQVIQDETPG